MWGVWDPTKVHRMQYAMHVADTVSSQMCLLYGGHCLPVLHICPGERVFISFPRRVDEPGNTSLFPQHLGSCPQEELIWEGRELDVLLGSSPASWVWDLCHCMGHHAQKGPLSLAQCSALVDSEIISDFWTRSSVFSFLIWSLHFKYPALPRRHTPICFLLRGRFRSCRSSRFRGWGVRSPLKEVVLGSLFDHRAKPYLLCMPGVWEEVLKGGDGWDHPGSLSCSVHDVGQMIQWEVPISYPAKCRQCY